MERARFKVWSKRLALSLALGAAGACHHGATKDFCDGVSSVYILTVGDWNAFAAKGCTSVPGLLEVRAIDPATPSPLRSVGGDLWLAGLGGMPADAFAALTSVGGRVIAAEGMTTLRLRALESTREVMAINTELVAIDLPALVSADVDVWAVDLLQTITMPMLQSADGPRGVNVSGGPALTTVSLPSLASVASGNLSVGGTAVSAIDLPALAVVGGDFGVGGPALAGVGLPGLVTIGGGFAVNSTSLTTLDLPHLATVGSYFLLQQNVLLASLQAPVLASVGGDFRVRSNALLRDCAAWAIRDQLTTLGGATDIFGNDTSATCP